MRCYEQEARKRIVLAENFPQEQKGVGLMLDDFRFGRVPLCLFHLAPRLRSGLDSFGASPSSIVCSIILF